MEVPSAVGSVIDLEEAYADLAPATHAHVAQVPLVRTLTLYVV